MEEFLRNKTFDYSLVPEGAARFVQQETREIIKLQKELNENYTNKIFLEIGQKLSSVRLFLGSDFFSLWQKEVNLSTFRSSMFMVIANVFKNCSEQTIENLNFQIAQLALMPAFVIEEVIACAESGEKIDGIMLERIKHKYSSLV